MNLTYEQLLELSAKGANIHVHLGGGAGGEPPPDNGDGPPPDDPAQYVISSRTGKGPRLYSPYQRNGKEPDRGGGLRIMLQTNNKNGKALTLQETDEMIVISEGKYATEAGHMDFYHVANFRDWGGFTGKWLNIGIVPPETFIFWVRKDQVRDV
jgi:hypothetical protein